ncbi:unnamed protein product [Sphacelaria rigidula]
MQSTTCHRPRESNIKCSDLGGFSRYLSALFFSQQELVCRLLLGVPAYKHPRDHHPRRGPRLHGSYLNRRACCRCLHVHHASARLRTFSDCTLFDLSCKL